MVTIKRTAAEWRALITEQKASGQPQGEWCETHGVNLYTFRDRVSRLNKDDSCSGWVEVKSETSRDTDITTERAKTFQSSQSSERKSSKIVIEIGTLRITAEATFPMTVLASLLREVTVQ